MAFRPSLPAPLVLTDSDLLAGVPFSRGSTYRHWSFVFTFSSLEALHSLVDEPASPIVFLHFNIEEESEEGLLVRGYLQCVRSIRYGVVASRFPSRSVDLYPTKYHLYMANSHKMGDSSIKYGADHILNPLYARIGAASQGSRRRQGNPLRRQLNAEIKALCL